MTRRNMKHQNFKKVFALAFAFALAFELFVLAGCVQNTSKSSAKGATGDTSVSFIDVGKGDCILIQTGESAALIDTGYEKTAPDVLAYLKERGVSRLECVILTHYDRDHVGGIRAIGEALDIHTVFLPGYEGSDKNYQSTISALNDLGLNTKRVTENVHLKLGEKDLDIFPSSVEYIPEWKNNEGNDNDCSIVASLTGNDASYLFTGDLEEAGIDAFLKANHGHFDIVKMPHHGKNTPNTDKLIEATSPKIAIITDSADQPAAKKTLKLLGSIGTDVYRTGKSSTIIVQNDGTGNYSVCE